MSVGAQPLLSGHERRDLLIGGPQPIAQFVAGQAQNAALLIDGADATEEAVTSLDQPHLLLVLVLVLVLLVNAVALSLFGGEGVVASQPSAFFVVPEELPDPLRDLLERAHQASFNPVGDGDEVARVVAVGVGGADGVLVVLGEDEAVGAERPRSFEGGEEGDGLQFGRDEVEQGLLVGVDDDGGRSPTPHSGLDASGGRPALFGLDYDDWWWWRWRRCGDDDGEW